MDAGKINSLILNLRAGESGARPGSTQSDAAFAAKMAAAVVLDDLLQVTEGDTPASPMVVAVPPSAPRSGIVVNLSTGVVAAEMAARAVHASSHPAEHSAPKADGAAAAATPPSSARVYMLTERLGESPRANASSGVPLAAAPAEDRRSVEVATPALTTPQYEPRGDVYPLVPPPGVPMNRLEIPEQRSSAAAATEQARESERLAGLNVKGEAPAMPRWLRLDRLALAAIVLGLALVILL